MFPDRAEAGRRLAIRLAERLDARGHELVVAAVPRGGVPVAAEVARALGAPLDVVVVRKLGLPDHPELAMGALGEDGVEVVDHELLRHVEVSACGVAEAVHHERLALHAEEARLRAHRPALSFAGRTVVVVDDGIATGATAHAACRVARARGAARVVMAAPVAAAGRTAEQLEADQLVVVDVPPDLVAVSRAYRDFSPVPDEECVRLMDAGRAAIAATRA